MGNSMRALCSIGCIVVLANWGSPETNVDGHNKQAVNFFGTLTTQRGKTYKVDNIAIGNRFKEIPFFEAVNGSIAKADADFPGALRLTTDPKEGIITKIDLAEIHEIRVPNPNKIWTFQKRKGFRKNEYIEVVVTTNDDARSSSTYLVDMRRKITCDQLNPAGPTEEVPFNALARLVIEGYKERTVTPTKKQDTKKVKYVGSSCPESLQKTSTTAPQTREKQEDIIVIDPIT